MSQMLPTIRPNASCGAFVEDVDLSSVTEAQVEVLRAALFEHGVLFFRDQALTCEQHVALAEKFAPIDINSFFPVADPGFPQIAKVEKTPDQATNIGGGWHTDHSYDQEPAMGSILVARDLPAQGGDTLFANMFAAYETLDEGTKAELRDLRAVHGSAHVFGKQSTYAGQDRTDLNAGQVDKADVVHPVVIKHPGSGKAALYVNPAFTLRFADRTREDSKPLLKRLYAHAARDEQVYRFAWRPGSVAIWDNRATWHFALNDYPDGYRLMHRITISGGPVEAAFA